jgi:hypothetical protein
VKTAAGKGFSSTTAAVLLARGGRRITGFGAAVVVLATITAFLAADGWSSGLPEDILQSAGILFRCLKNFAEQQIRFLVTALSLVRINTLLSH